MNRIRLSRAVLIVLLIVTPLAAQQAKQTESGLLTLDTIFTYHPQFPDQIQSQDNTSYPILEPSQNKKEVFDIVQYDAATGNKKIRVSAEKLIPPGASSPLMIEEYEFRRDGQKLLIFTNSAGVWRSNTRGD